MERGEAREPGSWLVYVQSRQQLAKIEALGGKRVQMALDIRVRKKTSEEVRAGERHHANDVTLDRGSILKTSH